MDQIFLLLLLIAIIAGLYWYHLKIDSELTKESQLRNNKNVQYKKTSSDTSSDENSFDNISIGTISMDSYNSSHSGGSRSSASSSMGSRLSYESSEKSEEIQESESGGELSMNDDEDEDE